ncbi:MAG: nitronate monooxygenase [Gammaproteobacteria bacterium]|nr:nitronate monooxygenase [Gammaproteobacteria bacterium]
MNDIVANIKARLSIPAFAAPMFLVSNPALVIEACKAGVIGSFPTLNARPVSALEEWLQQITTELAEAELSNPGNIAPWAANLIVHKSNDRFQEDLDLVIKYKAPIVISALGSPARIIDDIHGYGGLVFADVNSVEFAKKAAAAGADGLILIASGAGGHTGFTTPFSLVPAVRKFFDGPIVCGGGIGDGAGIKAMEILGADFAYIGTRFIATTESLASDEYKQMLVDAHINDIVTSPYFTGVPANYLKVSIEKAGIDLDELLKANSEINFDNADKRSKAWKDIWSAGQAVGVIDEVQSTADLINELKSGYDAA